MNNFDKDQRQGNDDQKLNERELNEQELDKELENVSGGRQGLGH